MKMKNYYWPDVLKDLHDEGKSPADEMQELIEYYEMLGGKFEVFVPLLKDLDARLKNGEPFDRKQFPMEPLMAGLYHINGVDFTPENEDEFRQVDMGNYELEVIWDRVTRFGEPYC